MNKYLIVLCVLLATSAGYFFYQWQYNYIGTISVNVPEGAKIIIDDKDFLHIETVSSYKVPLGYGRYYIEIPDYNIKCIIHKNNRGNAHITVNDVNEFTVKCDSNAHLVE